MTMMPNGTNEGDRYKASSMSKSQEEHQACGCSVSQADDEAKPQFYKPYDDTQMKEMQMRRDRSVESNMTVLELMNDDDGD